MITYPSTYSVSEPQVREPCRMGKLLPISWMYVRMMGAAYPVQALRRTKYWSPVGRVDNVHGDRYLFCSCLPVGEYASA